MENHDGDYYEPLWDQSGDFGGSEQFPDTMLQSGRTDICDSTALLQAVVFVEDAVKYRSINHKIDPVSLWYYRVYYSRPVQWLVYAAITVVHLLAFVERPSSLTWSSDPYYRGTPYQISCWAVSAIELMCLAIFTADVIMKIYLIGRKQLFKSKWLVAYVIIVIISLGDWLITTGLSCKIKDSEAIFPASKLFSHEENHAKYKKYTAKGAKMEDHDTNITLPTKSPVSPHTDTSVECLENCETPPKPDEFKEGKEYFNNITMSFISLLVLLTTANNPDVMMPAYQVNRLYSLYFITFLGIGE
ncbi:Two pore calcium channel protein 2 [Holothuria leucospilota]|uniref:Two pore calcium channel protein 2 n=1 Tax=Holothuria leucospilota TaxID=206669 RepID=A0A9Q1BTY9_HOLLE|nr:Two pore calcium channel protein 2 [Holothuria leucospilota]